MTGQEVVKFVGITIAAIGGVATLVEFYRREKGTIVALAVTIAGLLIAWYSSDTTVATAESTNSNTYHVDTVRHVAVFDTIITRQAATVKSEDNVSVETNMYPSDNTNPQGIDFSDKNKATTLTSIDNSFQQNRQPVVQTGQSPVYNNNVAHIPDCEQKKYGTFCFQSKVTYTLHITYTPVEKDFYQGQNIILQPNQSQFIYQVPVGVYKYVTIAEHGEFGVENFQGQFEIIQCQSGKQMFSY